MDKYDVKLVLTTEILGTVPDKGIYKDHIANDLPEEQLEEELETVPENLDKGWTGFHTTDGTPFLYDYVIKGFFKDACGMLRRCVGTESSKLRAYKKVVDGVVFIAPRKILLNLNGLEMGTNERPIRIDTLWICTDIVQPDNRRCRHRKDGIPKASQRVGYIRRALGNEVRAIVVDKRAYDCVLIRTRCKVEHLMPYLLYT